jgi:hypothetical protein
MLRREFSDSGDPNGAAPLVSGRDSVVQIICRSAFFREARNNPAQGKPWNNRSASDDFSCCV